MTTTMPLEDRIWSRVHAKPGCWGWLGHHLPTGYAYFSYRNAEGRPRTLGVHRFVYEQCVGPIADDFQVHHVCDNRGCVRPTHLWALPPRVHSALHNPGFHTYEENLGIQLWHGAMRAWPSGSWWIPAHHRERLRAEASA